MAIANYSDLQAAIIRWAMRTGEADFATDVPHFIDLAERRLNRLLRVRQMEASTSVSLIDGVGVLPANFLEVRRLVRSGAPDVVLEPLPPGGVTDLGSRSGLSRYYFVMGDALTVFPSMTGTAPLDYYAKIPSLSDNNPSNWLLQAAPDAYLYGSLLEAMPYEMDDQRASVWKTYFDTAVNDLRALDERSRYATVKTRVRGGVL